MLHKQQRRRRWGSSSLLELELEAAEYFKLDISQMELSRMRQVASNAYQAGCHSNNSLESFASSQSAAATTTTTTTMKPLVQPPSKATTGSSGVNQWREQPTSSRHCSNSGPRQQQPQQQTVQRAVKTSGNVCHREKATQTRATEVDGDQSSRNRACKMDCTQVNQRAGHTRCHSRTDASRLGIGGDGSSGHCNQDLPVTVVVGSSTTSTNSLPSITSSPSVSPSLVCPHLSLDDILGFRQGSSGSPHTIGLCPKCRLDPPPNIHSPLSPQFRPHSRSSPGGAGGGGASGVSLNSPRRVRRGYSDHHESYCSMKQTRRQQQQQLHQATTGTGGQMTFARHQSDLMRSRDDSLDFCLEPSELRRMQLSPTMRNSVEFIRRNSIESGRVVRIYKNGEPFEKPLRICILRGEFANLTHLLDHINSRLLISSGARYLFHLDGQLVYSVHELKHGSVYVVSGTRSFDYRTSEVLKEQQRREQLTRVSQEQRALIRQQLEMSGGQQRTSTNAAPSNCRHSSTSWQITTMDGIGAGRASTTEQKRAKTQASSSELSTKGNTMIGGTNRIGSKLDKTHVSQSIHTGKPRSQPTGLSFRSIEPRRMQPKSTTNKSGRRHHDGTIVSGSSGQLPTASDQSMSLLDDEKPIKLTRAKSELSALPLKKQKKNVTFMDTGRGSSPAISDLSSSGGETTTTTNTGTVSRRTVSTTTLTEPTDVTSGDIEEPQSQLKKELGTSEVGIQVSDSIDGFLIDLPVPLPAKGDDSSLVDPPRAQRSRPTASQKPARGSNRTGGSSSQESSGGGGAGATKRAKQIVTITERQLSHEEMTELTDLSEGDHHDHHEVIIKWGPPEEIAVSQEPSPDPEEELLKAELAADRSNTIAIGSDPQPETETLIGSGRLVTSAVKPEQMDAATAPMSTKTDGHWQYPGGDADRSTPAERPVSQIEPNESVRARVTTPTPSLSTGGDNNSLTLSYDTTSMTVVADGRAQEDSVRSSQLTSGRHATLPVKRRSEVMGTLCDGLDAPSQNFRLVWVNGFAINDLYPENSVDVQRLAENETAVGRKSPKGDPQSQVGAARLSPSRGGSQQRTNQAASEFKPSERYHNWICHSRKHDELVYPAGALIVLWCRWTNEQRYYARHTSNVSCLTLASLDSDLAASAQTRDPFEGRQIGSVIHLWCLSSLALLRIIDDDQFRSKLIFSMRLKSSKSSGCELSVAARDEKQLFLLEFSGKLAADSETSAPVATETRRNSKGSISGAGGKAVPSDASALMMRASKILQSNQLPLFVMRVPKLGPVSQHGEPQPSLTKQKQQQAEPLICFGRRHFSMWAADVKQRKLRPMQADQKSAKLTELVNKANCLCRISPDEFLLGDSEGSITMLLINCGVNQQPSRGTTGAGGLSKRKVQPKAAASLGLLDSGTDSRYSIETIELLRGSANTKPSDRTSASISCLTRISGSLFMSADATCTIRFWKLKRRGPESPATTEGTAGSSAGLDRRQMSCEQVSSISLPPDLGFICSIILAQYKLKESIVEFYVVSTSNSILFGSVKLPPLRGSKPSSPSSPNRQTSQEQNLKHHQQQSIGPADLLANSSLSVVYEGHETSVSGLVADLGARAHGEDAKLDQGRIYFTCSLDCRICKWNGKQLIWKSMLPSSCVSLAAHPRGCVLAVGSVDGTVYILDKTSGLLISYFPLTPVRINCLAYSRDGTLLAAGCANGSIFMLPVDERGLKYRKVSIFQSPNAVVSLQFSLDNRYMLTSVSHGSYQELVLWDLPNFRYMRDDVKLAADKIQWFDSICSGSEDVRAIWENAHLSSNQEDEVRPAGRSAASRRLTGSQLRNKPSDQFVVNLSCHRLIRPTNESEDSSSDPAQEGFVIASDTRGYLRLFRYPAYDIQQGFYAARICSSAVNCCRFLTNDKEDGDNNSNTNHFVSTSLDGSICLWALE